MISAKATVFAFLFLLGFACASYDQSVGDKFVGAQHWNESGWYADGGFKSGYDGYFCLCSCNAVAEGVFCSGGGVKPDGVTKVADFLGVFAQDLGGRTWTGKLAAYGTKTPFADTFTMTEPGGPLELHRRFSGITLPKSEMDFFFLSQSAVSQFLKTPQLLGSWWRDICVERVHERCRLQLCRKVSFSLCLLSLFPLLE